MDEPAAILPMLLALAWLLPLASFALIVFFGPRMGSHGRLAGYLATAAIMASCVLSLSALAIWNREHPITAEEHDASVAAETGGSHTPARAHQSGEHAAPHARGEHAGSEHTAPHDTHAPPPSYSGDWYTLGQFGALRVTIGYYIDALTVLMFSMVTFIATCIHFYANGYMHDELHDVTDHEVTLSDGHHLHRHGRFHRFFQYLSLFCFSMLGIVIAGNIAMVFVFWELVGICSYFLIGFYIERKSASNAANKAFIVNRVGDFGMIIGLMALFGTLGTFAFGDVDQNANGKIESSERGIFSQVRPPEQGSQLRTPAGMVKAAAAPAIAEGETASAQNIDAWRDQMQPGEYGHSAYWLLIIAGLGIFCGCVGKSAQFPLHVWLPDAMEGPTPVSALVHSATMVAAGVYLVGRFYPVFTPEVLLVIAITGCITLLLAATIAITATDIKRVLAYSTVSQLGYMMMALGVGGWAAGLFHLITHAFFKSLLFMCSGSVIHACHTNEMPRMGGLRKKMPYTAYTMLVGCLAIAGAGLPFAIGSLHVGLSGYYSKDAILAQAMSFRDSNPGYGWIFFAAAIGALLTAFYMFRLWFLTFAGEPRDHHVYEHAHESPKVMYLPLVVLAAFAIGVGWSLPGGFGVAGLLEQARPAGTMAPMSGSFMADLQYPSEHDSHAFHTAATLAAFTTAGIGIVLAIAFYGVRFWNPENVRRQFGPVYRLLINKWYFDEIYAVLFIKPVMILSRWIAEFDRRVIDWFIDHLAIWAQAVSRVDDMIDRYFVDGLVNWTAKRTYSAGMSLHNAQTGRLRQYVMFIVVGTVGLFMLLTFFWNSGFAGH